MITAKTMIASYQERLYWETKAHETLARTLSVLHVPELKARGEKLLTEAEAKIAELQLCMSKLQAIV